MLYIPGKSICSKKNQQGVVMVVVAIGAFVIVGMAGLALDYAHAVTNRARLQNSLDAAALGAARTLTVTSSQAQADAAGRLIFTQNINAAENSDLLAGGATANTLTIEFSDTVKPFVVDPAATNFVRIRMNSSLTYATWFMSVFGQNNLNINSSAVAGVSPVLGFTCNLAPFVVCGDENAVDESGNPIPNYGYPFGSTVTVKLDSNDSDIGVGNFQLVRLNEDDAGGADVRENLAGASENCLGAGDPIETEPGNTIGPVAQGMNTRFGEYRGPVSADDYPPDKVVEEYPTPADGSTPAISPFSLYQARYGASDWDYNDGQENRRVMSVPIADCSALNNGQSTLPTFPTPLCIFLTEKAGSTGQTQDITVEVIDGCVVQGVSGPAPVLGPGPTTPILYGDADRWDT